MGSDSFVLRAGSDRVSEETRRRGRGAALVEELEDDEHVVAADAQDDEGHHEADGVDLVADERRHREAHEEGEHDDDEDREREERAAPHGRALAAAREREGEVAHDDDHGREEEGHVRLDEAHDLVVHGPVRVEHKVHGQRPRVLHIEHAVDVGELPVEAPRLLLRVRRVGDDHGARAQERAVLVAADVAQDRLQRHGRLEAHEHVVDHRRVRRRGDGRPVVTEERERVPVVALAVGALAVGVADCEGRARASGPRKARARRGHGGRGRRAVLEGDLLLVGDDVEGDVLVDVEDALEVLLREDVVAGLWVEDEDLVPPEGAEAVDHVEHVLVRRALRRDPQVEAVGLDLHRGEAHRHQERPENHAPDDRARPPRREAAHVAARLADARPLRPGHARAARPRHAGTWNTAPNAASRGMQGGCPVKLTVFVEN